jgi:hypothetical protein
MNDFDYWVSQADDEKKEIQFKLEKSAGQLSNEAIFHLPLIAFAILSLAVCSRPIRTKEVGQIIGECFERVFKSFKGSTRYFGWSTNLRVRLALLEHVELVTVDQKSMVKSTEKGRVVINSMAKQDIDLNEVMTKVQDAYRDVIAEKTKQMELL